MNTSHSPSVHVVTFRYGHPGNPDMAISVPADVDAHRIAAYLQFRAEDWFGLDAVLFSKGAAEALVEFYGCTPADMPSPVPAWPDPQAIDLYWECERRCGEAIALAEDPELARDGLREFLSTRYDA